MSSNEINVPALSDSDRGPAEDSKMERPVVCVFCGSKTGKSPAHMAASRALAHALHENNYKLVYGGGTTGMMGELAKTLVSLSGPEAVHGVIPQPLIKTEQGYNESSSADKVVTQAIYGRTTVVKDMHIRKEMMASEVRAGGPGSGFITLTGGYGTLEELMEMVTWNQLSIHSNGIVVFDVEGYWDGLFRWINKSIEQDFITEDNASIMVKASTASDAVSALMNYKNSPGRLPLQWTSTDS